MLFEGAPCTGFWPLPMPLFLSAAAAAAPKRRGDAVLSARMHACLP